MKRFLIPFLLLAITACRAQSITTDKLSPSTRGWYLSTQTALALTGTFGEVEPGATLELYTTRIGYGLTESLLIGAQVGLLGIADGDSGGSGAAINFAPFVRYYTTVGTPRLKVFFEAGLGLNEARYVYSDGDAPKFHAALGLEQQLTRGVHATALLAFNGLGAGVNEVSLSLGFNNFLRQLSFYDSRLGFQKGQFLLDSSWGVLSRGGGSKFSEIKENTFHQIQLTPSLGYFLTSRLIAEATLTYERSGRKSVFEDDSFDERLAESAGLDLGVRYLLSRSTRVAPYLALRGGYTSRRSAFGSTGDPIESDSFSTTSVTSVKGIVGAFYRLKNHLLLDAGLSYTALSYTFRTREERSNRLRLQAGLVVLLGE